MRGALSRSRPRRGLAGRGVSEEADLEFMRRALTLAAERLGRTWPNPAVGCVLAKQDMAIAEGATGEGGRPHAEEVALAAAGPGATGATAYIALEPCARRSSTALSCTDRLIAARVARVVVATRDPHPNAAGVGVERLKQAGIAVEEGLCGEEARALNAGFIARVVTGLPLVAADAARQRYDASFNPSPGEDMRAALRRLGAAGFTRLCVPPGGPLAAALEQEGLLSAPFLLSWVGQAANPARRG